MKLSNRFSLAIFMAISIFTISHATHRYITVAPQVNKQSPTAPVVFSAFTLAHDSTGLIVGTSDTLFSTTAPTNSSGVGLNGSLVGSSAMDPMLFANRNTQRTDSVFCWASVKSIEVTDSVDVTFGAQYKQYDSTYMISGVLASTAGGGATGQPKTTGPISVRLEATMVPIKFAIPLQYGRPFRTYITPTSATDTIRVRDLRCGDR